MHLSSTPFHSIRTLATLAAALGLAIHPVEAQVLTGGMTAVPSLSLSRLDTDGDGLADVVDNCREVPNRGALSCDTDGDGFGNACDADFDQNGTTNSVDFMSDFLTDFSKGVDAGRGTDMDCNGEVNAVDFLSYFLPSFSRGTPGPRARPVESKVVEDKTRTLGGRDYRFQKHLGVTGNTWEVVLDARGVLVDPSALPRTRHSVVNANLAKLLALIERGEIKRETLHVKVATDFALVDAPEVRETGSVAVSSGAMRSAVLNGQQVSEAELDDYAQTREGALLEQVARSEAKRQQYLRAWAERKGFEKQPGLLQALNSTSRNVVLKLTPAQIGTLAKDPDGVVRGIKLYEPPQEEIVQATIATNVRQWALPFPDSTGSGIGVYMTESGCPEPGFFGNYTNLSGTAPSNHSRNVAGIIRGVSPAGYLYCRGGSDLPNAVDLYGVKKTPRIQAVTMSMMLAGGTDYETEDRDWDDFIYRHRLPAFKSAGNQGLANGEVTSPGKGLNVIAVGNYDDSDNSIAPKSSFVDPETGNEKPEIVAPGTKIVAGGFTMSGTSMASPHAAGFAADMMSKYSWLRFRPSLIKANLLSGATDSIVGPADAVGLGGIDFLSAAYNGHNVWWNGSPDDFDFWDASDGVADETVEFKLFINNDWELVRATLSWLTRGSYTFEHATDAHPIGMDLDITVSDPAGALLDVSVSFDNGFESLEFPPTTTGTYTFRIHRFSNNDLGNRVRMGLAIDYFNL